MESQGSDQQTFDNETVGGGESLITNEDTIQDVDLLYMYCGRAYPPENSSEEALEDADNSWEPVREWLRTHSQQEAAVAAKQRADSSLTALHLACRNRPPLDVVQTLLAVAPETARWPDGFSWLPIHYSCACGAEKEVIRSLAEAYPDSKTTVDRRSRTPLHFALGSIQQLKKPVSPEVVALLSNTGAAGYADEHGMLPLHYACAYGASEEVVGVLTQTFQDAITLPDEYNRLPLQYALSNAGQATAPVVIRHLLTLNPTIASYDDGGQRFPLLVLAKYTSDMTEKQKNKPEVRERIKKCLECLLLSEPVASAAFFTSLRALPDWLCEKAVVMPIVQKYLNDKIAQRFPAAVLMLDLYFIALAIIFYFLSVEKSLEKRYNPEKHNGQTDIKSDWLVALYLSGAYFLVRDGVQMVFQIISHRTLKAFYFWLRDPSKILNLAFIFVIFFWTVQMDRGSGDKDSFRIGTALCVMILWVKLLAYLRNMLIDFAVFVGGVTYVVRRLAAFLISLVIILIAFTQMFYTVFQESDNCVGEDLEALSNQMIACEDYDNARPFCKRVTAFLHVYTMLLGEIDDGEFEDSVIAMVLFFIFMFMVVILLANVLIAIVTDSYKVIQDQRAAIVFWMNRLDFVAEMDVIANGPWKDIVRQRLGWERETSEEKTKFGADAWNGLMNLFSDDVEDGVFTFEYLLYFMARLFVLIFIIPLWLCLGIVSAGWLWPPQLRQKLFTSTVKTHNSESEKEDEQRKQQVKLLEEEVQNLKDELSQQLATDRTQVVQMKSAIDERKMEIYNQIKAVKRIMTMLFEQQAGV